ncbi:MAG: glycosyltransferase family 39 protein [bacterium]|nr:glycosyltransferase family 39 protein [bacterium]
MNNFFGKIKKHQVAILLMLIILVGIFLRTYHFSDWLRFNMDQSRDVELIENLSENNRLPDLGPGAGGTEFLLGPAFYYFQLVSAKIFGAEPEKVAYPDLFFSILSIGMFFLLAKIYFKIPIALALAWLYSISYFAIKFSRFAWNPNSTPFFVMLFIYALYNLAILQKRKIAWAILTGISLGICIQLHTSLLIILPVLSFFTAIIFFKKKIISATAIVIIVASTIFVNIPQIVSEVRSGGANSYQFILGITSKNERNGSWANNLLLNFSCHIKTNNHILTSLGNENECGYENDWKIFKKLDGTRMTIGEKASFVVLIILSLVFSLGGYFLLFKKAIKESDRNKKLFLGLISSYIILSFLFYITWATELAVRFFLPLLFIPLLILGFWLNFFEKKFKKGLWVAIAIIAIFSSFNLQKIFYTYKDLQYGGREINGDFDYLTLGEGKYIVDFIKNNSENKTAYIDAQAGYLFKSLRSLQFLAGKEQIEIIQLRKEIKLNSGDKLFYLKNASAKCELSQEIAKKYDIEKCSIFRQFSVFALKVK